MLEDPQSEVHQHSSEREHTQLLIEFKLTVLQILCLLGVTLIYVATACDQKKVSGLSCLF